jgi:hypothetical protein
MAETVRAGSRSAGVDPERDAHRSWKSHFDDSDRDIASKYCLESMHSKPFSDLRI